MMSATRTRTKTPKNKGARADATPEAEGVEASGKIRINLRIDAADFERLMVHCVKERKQPGEMVGDLIRANLRKYRVQEIAAAKPGDSRDERDPHQDEGSANRADGVESSGAGPVADLPAATDGAVRSRAA
jgi:hypothetical protein